jgi:hypothetical protein
MRGSVARPWEKFELGGRLEEGIRSALAAAMNPEEVFVGEPGHLGVPWGTLWGSEEKVMAALALLEACGLVGPAADIFMGLLRGLLRGRAQSMLASQGTAPLLSLMPFASDVNVLAST